MEKGLLVLRRVVTLALISFLVFRIGGCAQKNKGTAELVVLGSVSVIEGSVSHVERTRTSTITTGDIPPSTYVSGPQGVTFLAEGGGLIHCGPGLQIVLQIPEFSGRIIDKVSVSVRSAKGYYVCGTHKNGKEFFVYCVEDGNYNAPCETGTGANFWAQAYEVTSDS